MSLHDAEVEAKRIFERQKTFAVKVSEKKYQKASKRVEERVQTLQTCRDWQKVYHEGLLLQANLFRITKGMKEIAVSDWENEGAERVIPLAPLVMPKDQVANIFRRSKKLKAGESHADRLLKTAEHELSLCQVQKDALETIVDADSLADFNIRYGISRSAVSRPLTRKIAPPPKPYHTFVSQAGIEIWVGKSAKDNDKLSFQCANGLDLWLHAHNYPGSHVVIRSQKSVEVDSETLNDAAELALRYSKAKESSSGEVSLTQVKGLTRVKGAPGKVMISKHKVLRIALDDARWKRLKNKV